MSKYYNSTKFYLLESISLARAYDTLSLSDLRK